MKNENLLLTASSLLSILLMSIHVTEDIVRGYEKWSFEKLSFVLILVVWLCGTLLLNERRLGRIVMFLGGLLASLMPAAHMRGSGAFVKSSGAFFFIWTILAVGAIGAFSVILAIRAMWRSGKMTAVAHESPDRRG